MISPTRTGYLNIVWPLSFPVGYSQVRLMAYPTRALWLGAAARRFRTNVTAQGIKSWLAGFLGSLTE